jgi:hypothetical protein
LSFYSKILPYCDTNRDERGYAAKKLPQWLQIKIHSTKAPKIAPALWHYTHPTTARPPQSIPFCNEKYKVGVLFRTPPLLSAIIPLASKP